MQDGIYVKITTQKGEILGQLTYKRTPGTVANFVALAEGNLENTAKDQGTPYYDGLTFHRVIPDFMIQGGDPAGTGHVFPSIASTCVRRNTLYHVACRFDQSLILRLPSHCDNYQHSLDNRNRNN